MELGSEYSLALSELRATDDNLFAYLAEEDCLWLDSGRSALRMIPPAGGTVLLPEYICESVVRCFDPEKISFYRVNPDFTIDFADLAGRVTPETGTIFFAHYLGAVQPAPVLRQIRELADRCGITVIEDTTQSLFSVRHTVGDMTAASVRKWMPLPMGGVLYRPKGQTLPSAAHLTKSTDNRRAEGMVLKELFLRGVLACNETYREIFAQCEHRLDEKQEILELSDLARFILSCTDISLLRARRIANYQRLRSGLETLGLTPACPLKEGDCPLVLPIRVPHRDDLRRYLMENKVYCAVHWPFDGLLGEMRETARFNADTLLSLPIDQRYSPEEMDALTEILSKYRGELQF